jgi:hypothetical protein
MAEEKFRLPRSSYEQLVRIIQAYGQFNAEATLDEVANIAGTQRTVVSANNGFLADTGLLAGGNKKILTDPGRGLARALEFDNQEDTQRLWREVISDTDFFRSVLSAVRIRRGMDASTLQTHIAYSAGLPKNKGVMTGAACVIDVLEVAGLLREDEGKLVAVPAEDVEARDVSVVSPSANEAEMPPPPQVGEERGPVVVRGRPGVQIQIQIACSADEIEDLAPKLRKLLEELEVGAEE